MIARLTGILEPLGEDRAIVDVGGVGYMVFCSGRTLGQLPADGSTVQLHIETHVREDHIHLYGFAELGELEWFRLLTTVQGVGAKVALAILTVLGPDDLLQAVAAADKVAVSRANGVGPKLAARIVSELKDKIGGIALGKAAAIRVAGGQAAPAAGGIDEDAVSALVNLGYGRSEAFGAVARAGGRLAQGAPLGDLIRAGLEELSQ
ncbi:MAG: Holliday junction branch migration protein RuvA [Alphaproteobacteria bacterium]|nr:Holliday junction branch migration protein RuvA [Alphaproteobacteria bacterium]